MNTFASPVRTSLPQSFITTYAPRLRSFGNSLLTPVVHQVPVNPTGRSTKRATTAINYAEDGFDDEDFYDSEAPRRPTGLRSLRRDDSTVERAANIAHLGKEATEPVEVQGIWRDWMAKPKKLLSRKQLHTQAELPVTLIPIRIDLDILPFRPDAAFPAPPNSREFGIDESLPTYKPSDITPQFRLKDMFLWNLHESIVTPDQFAKLLVDELDLPNDRKPLFIHQIATQIRTQLEEYAGVALHPLFHSSSSTIPPGSQAQIQAADTGAATPQTQQADAGAATLQILEADTGAATPQANGTADVANGSSDVTEAPQPENGNVSAVAEKIDADGALNPDDTYRCIVSLNVNIMNKLYTDKFEWSLLHPPGYAEAFAKQTCADLGLAAEWVPAITHAIYEAVLRLKKEACENGGLVGYGDLDNDCAEGADAGWRYEPERLGDDWEPKIEVLSKEEIDRREGDRERQVRRQRRETARFSSTANMIGAVPQGDYFTNPDMSDQPMGRGERSKKKRRFRSVSPTARDTPDTGYGGGTGLQEADRQHFRCSHCCIWGSAVWAVRDGPAGPRTLCNNCGFLYERDKTLPPWSKGLYISDRPVIK